MRTSNKPFRVALRGVSRYDGMRGTAHHEGDITIINWDYHYGREEFNTNDFDSDVKQGTYEILDYVEQISSRKRIDIQD